VEKPSPLDRRQLGVLASPRGTASRLLQAALAGFLFQLGCKERAVSRHYLDGLFQRDPATAARPISHN